ncbi:MAG: UvrD-helicase domain-containing protein [Verrucomicrobiales bacterium]|nr:UvrD-helicase domain-containing protein [Verrucomicrobiales bacterium]
MNGSTPNQERAIGARGNVLVQAGAGAGKTRTLVQRCVRWLLEDAGNSLDQILMVTFTEAAASEMRQRIRAELSASFRQHPDNQHIAEQLALLPAANISTLHSFCLQLVRQHFYELELDPQVTVLAEKEAPLLADETLASILQRHYAGQLANSQAVQELIQVQGRGWDKPIRKLVLHLFEYTQTLPNPARWFYDQLAMFDQAEPRRWEHWLREFLPRWSDQWLTDLQSFTTARAVAKATTALRKVTEQAAWPDLHSALSEIVRAGDRTNRELWPRGSIGEVRDQIRDFFEEAEFLQCLTGDEEGSEGEPGRGALDCPRPLLEDWSWAREPMIALLQLTQEFGREFAEVKRELGVVDFHDLEQFSLRLLWDARSEQPTPLAGHWRGKLRLIFVDEYQDINAAQDAILRALAREGEAANRFMVGDVKQSIYRFRLADPHIFQSYVQDWQDESSGGQVIPLQENFRSHEAILDFINPFFAAIMRKEMGGVEFGPEAALLFGDRTGRSELTYDGETQAGVTPHPRPHVELHLCLTGTPSDTDDEDSNETPMEEGGTAFGDLSKEDNEARTIGLRLREMRAQQFTISDDDPGQFRPVEWRDMVILLRSRKNKVESYAKEFARLGIPLAAPHGSLFESIEILDLLNLLKVLDNPLQDIEVIAVLRSPLVGLTLDELAMIRLAAKGRFWTALRRFYRTEGAGISGQSSVVSRQSSVEAEAKEPLNASAPPNAGGSGRARTADYGPRTTFQKIDRFLKSYSHWRRLARETSLSQCLEEILHETHYSIWLLTQPRGQQRQANIATLLNWAREFDRFHRQGLFRFLRFIEAQREAEIDYEPVPAIAENAVRLMSIHQSKGLEFPVVVVGDLGGNFNLSDLRGEIILDEIYGLCPQIKPPFTGQRYPSLPHWLAQRRQRAETLGEEMRILYVAFTRACHTLVLVGTTTRKHAFEDWPAQASPATRRLWRARNCLDWLGPWLPTATGRPDWLARGRGESRLLRWRVSEGDDSRSRTPIETDEGVDSSLSEILDPGQIQAIRERLAWSYPFAAATSEPAKASVSGLRRRILDEAETEVPQIIFAPKDGAAERGRSVLSAAEIGTAHHAFLQFVSLDKVNSVGGLETEARRLEASHVLSGPEREALDLPRIAAFWQSAVGQRVLAHRDAIQRELPFTARFSAAELARLVPRDDNGSVLQNIGTVSPISNPPDRNDRENSSRNLAAGHTLAALGALPDEFIVVQGVVDLAVVLLTEIWLLDFKTDDVNDREWPHKVRTYGPQLKLYSLALGRIYRRSVTNCWLHFLKLNRTVECNDL